jgi:anthranilate synthase
VFTSSGLGFTLEALNGRGQLFLSAIERQLQNEASVEHLEREGEHQIRGVIVKTSERFPEEERSRQPSVFSVLRALRELFFSEADSHLGLYGAFGYDLCFQFEPVKLQRPRPENQRDLVLYLPDELVVVDRQKERSERLLYDFEVDGQSTAALPRSGQSVPYVPAQTDASCDHAPGEYAANVERAKELFKRGDLFELVLSQTFTEPCPRKPSEIFRHLQKHNPAPYALFINLGQAEYLVGASPEMYVRVEGRRVETCPISGTIPRGSDAVEDAEQIRQLLMSVKDESELTMCTDVDRNDKSRICEAGSVQVIGRRQIELYSRLIHTVDHVEGTLREGFDSLDAFLSHTWAVTVTGAPKPSAIQHVEAFEKSSRAWYAGAVGVIAFDGNLNTGLTLRTVRLVEGKAEVRAGATLLFDSDCDAEERETRLKASAFLDAVRFGGMPPKASAAEYRGGQGLRILLVDHHDSFVHTLANYLRQTGAEVITLRTGFPESDWNRLRPDLVVLSPGPGSPSEFRLSDTISAALERGLPVFGVCLGLQGIVEHFGGRLGILDYPMHGKPSALSAQDSPLFAGIASPFRAGRYHSLFAKIPDLPQCLRATAFSEDGVVMAVEHVNLKVAAVQFHPESILSLGGQTGLRILDNAIRWLRG